MPILASYVVPHPPLIIPQIGKGNELAIQDTIDAYEAVAKRIAALAPDTIVFITPHAVSYSNYIHISGGLLAEGDFGSFGVPELTFGIMYEKKLAQDINAACEEAGLAAGTQGADAPEEQALDHGTMIPLYFIQKYFQDFRCLRISISYLPLAEHYRLGQIVDECCERFHRNTVVIASGDLSHKLKETGPYGFSESGPAFDEKIQQIIRTADFSALLQLDESFCEAAAECGLRPMTIMAGMLDQKSVQGELLSYEGPFGVGYAVGAFDVSGADADRNFLAQWMPETISTAPKSAHVQIAQAALESYICTGKVLELPENTPPELLDQRAGAFVSIKKAGQLRGCIGTIGPVQENVALEIVANAISAGTKDPRFPPITTQELSELTYSVDVLGMPEKVEDIALLDAKKYGVIVSHSSRRGLLLPNLDGVDTVADQLAIALEKGGIDPSAPYMIERFEVVRYH